MISALALSFTGFFELSTPELHEYFYSREAGVVEEVFIKGGELVKEKELLMIYAPLEEQIKGRSYLFSTIEGTVFYEKKIKVGSLFREGELLFKVKSNKKIRENVEY